jgi:hypothetical protein
LRIAISIERNAPFGIDFGAALLGVLIFLETHDTSAFAHDETVAVPVVRTATAPRFVTEAGRQRARLAKTGDADRADRAFRTAGEHHVGIVHRDHPRGVADRMRACRTRRDDGVVRAHQAVFDLHLTGDQIDQAAMDEMRRDALGPLCGEHQRFAFDARQATNARSDRATGAKAFFLAHLGQAGIFERLAGGIDAVDDERIDLALNLVVDALVGIEAIFVIGRLHFACIIAVEIGRVEARDRPRARFGRDDVFPGRFDIRPQGGHQAQAGHDYAPHGLLQSKSLTAKRPPGPG